MLAVTVETRPVQRLVLAEAPEPQAAADELTIAVRAISLNRGEVLNALVGGAQGHRPGWDYAGVVQTAPKGSSYAAGDRVVGLLPRGAWAERVATSPGRIARLPDAVSFSQAAALPVAGLTAALALGKGGPLDGRSILVTGATGGVGLIAVQIAANQGARVTALVRDAAQEDLLRRLGAATVAVGLEAARAAGPFDLIVEAVGGDVLGAVLGMLASRGQCVLVGDAGGSNTTFNGWSFRENGGTVLYGFFLGEELTREQPTTPLAALVDRVASGELDPIIAIERSWTEIDATARQLLDRGYFGKAVLTLDAG